MQKVTTWAGLDVHAERIVIVIATLAGQGRVRGRAVRFRVAPAAHLDGHRVRGHRAVAHPGEGWRPGEDRPARCPEAGAAVPGGRADGRDRAERFAGGGEGPGQGPRRRAQGPDRGAPPTGEVPHPPRPSLLGQQQLDAAVLGLGQQAHFRARGRAADLPAPRRRGEAPRRAPGSSRHGAWADRERRALRGAGAPPRPPARDLDAERPGAPGRDRRLPPLQEPAPAHGLPRPGAARVLERRQGEARGHHQDRQRSRPPPPRRGSLELPPPAGARRARPRSTPGPARRGGGRRSPGPGAAAPPLRASREPREAVAGRGHGGGANHTSPIDRPFHPRPSRPAARRRPGRAAPAGRARPPPGARRRRGRPA